MRQNWHSRPLAKASKRQADNSVMDAGDPFLEAQRRPVPLASPEGAMLFALIDDTTRILASKKKDRSSVELKRRAMNWIAGEPPAEGCFSFQQVADHLGIDASILRDRLYNVTGRSRRRAPI